LPDLKGTKDPARGSDAIRRSETCVSRMLGGNEIRGGRRGNVPDYQKGGWPRLVQSAQNETPGKTFWKKKRGQRGEEKIPRATARIV